MAVGKQSFRAKLEEGLASETSPLNPENLKLAREKAEAAGKAISAYARSFANGNASIRMLALIGGCMLCADSLTTFLANLFDFHFNRALIDMYAFAVGFAAIVMESDREAIPYAIKIRTILGKNFGIVRSVTGRGLFYGVAASLELNDAGARSQLIGYFVLAVSVAYIVFGRIAHTKIAKIRSEKFSNRKIKSMFAKYDQDDSDSIDFNEFQKLLADLDMEQLTHQEAELLYLSIDKNMNHVICLEEFQNFWANSPELDTFAL